MSFLSSMQQYVTSGISSLGLGNRRFSLSRQESSEQQSGSSAGGPASSTQQQQQSGFPQQHPQLLQTQLSQQQLLQQQQQQVPHGHAPLQQQASIGSGLGVYGAPAAPTGGVAPTASGSNYPSGGVVIGNPNATNPLLGEFYYGSKGVTRGTERKKEYRIGYSKKVGYIGYNTIQ